jgi:UDP-glucose 4-epimerase
MAKTLVTGGAGFIGSHVVDALIRRGHHVAVIDDLSVGRRANVHGRAKLHVLDIRSPRLGSFVRRLRPSYVFHLAAQKNVRTSIDDPIFDADVNILGSLNLIKACVAAKVKRFIFSSTGGAMYGKTQYLPTPETVPPRPEAPYGIAKITIERYLDFFRIVFGLSSVSLRYGNVYGPRQDPEGEAGVIAIFAQRLFQRKPVLINGHGRQTRDYVFVSDVVQANIAALFSRRTGPINIGTGRQVSVNELARQFIRMAKRHVPIHHRPAIAGEVLHSALDVGLAKQTLRWHPRIPLSVGLRQTWLWAEEVMS